MHPLSNDLVTVPEAAKLLAPGRPSKSGHRSESCIYKWLKDGTLTKYGGEAGGPTYVSLTELRLKFLVPQPLVYRQGRWTPRQAS